MSLQVLANTLQNQGRGNDSMLVHMTPGEVAGLQSLALSKGGSLTINPVTGLPEAGFLDTMLSIGGGFLGGMVGGPLGAAIGSGLGSYLGGASPQQALMSGVLSYGLGGLGEGLQTEGVQALNKAAVDALPTPESLIASQSEFGPPTPTDVAGIREGFGRQVGDIITKNNALSPVDKLSAGWNAVDPMQFAKDNWKYLGAAGLGAAGLMAPQQAAALGPQAKTGYAPQYTWNPQTRRYEDAPARPYTYFAANGGTVPYPAGGAGYPQQNVMDKTDFYAQSTANPTPTSVIGAAPKTDYDARITQQGDEFKAAGGGEIRGFKSGGPYGSAGPIYGIAGPIYAGDSSLSSKTGLYQSSDAYSGISQQMNKMSPAKLKILAEDATDPIVMAAAQAELYSRANAAPSGYIDKPTIQAAEGGTIKMADGGLPGFLGMLQQTGVFGPLENKPVQYSYDPKEQRYTQMAQGGIASPGEYAAGGKLLQGPGDGMSDSIPAVIKGPKPQRAALAQGEFVIPADVVSHLGNGSTDAGAKRLYSMMDKIRMARTGTKKQGRQINPAKFMPA